MALTDDAIGRIKSKITSGELAPGDRLPPEAELAESLGISRNSLREAVKALELVRVLTVRRGDGTYVTSLAPELLLEAFAFVIDMHDDRTLLDLLQVRRVLESHAAGMAAQVATPADIDDLRQLARSVGDEANMEEIIARDIAFHRRIADLSGNHYLASLIDTLTPQTVRVRVWRGRSESDAVARTLDEHDRIVDAIAAGDIQLASAAASVHVSGVEAWLRQRVESSQGPETTRPSDPNTRS